MLERVSGESIHEALTALLRAEIVREVSRYPEFECSFTHGLLREAALSTLTSARKRTLYASIAAAFEDIYAGESLDEHLERLAHYHAQAGNFRRRSSSAGANARRVAVTASARATSPPRSRRTPPSKPLLEERRPPDRRAKTREVGRELEERNGKRHVQSPASGRFAF